ncbi:4-hydroxy-tetrahydrodipicolinate synthase [Oscillibacter sp. PC13]|uniref:dihydrodipicolinate synthase family protein n=1 Tax=Oscillibacter sp. PC13 TaxID=1855299 RepID=UPI0008DFC53A|nr:dihydrodipicolinate synthase family protein [Oscillibacter sp. PC13]SFP36224.1 4-hydroxy-tetrahydrodipicolinate synthase [Oscillibacter sp. PC13]
MVKIITPVITVLNENEKPDYEGNKKVIDHLVSGGVDGILVLGSAGEFPNLTIQERLDFFQFYADYTAGRVELLAGTGCVSYQDTLTLSNAVYDMGYTAPMVIGPYYFGLDQEKVFLYYDRLAKEVKGDLYLYNFPPRSGHSIAPETIGRLVEANSNIVGLKDSVTEPVHTNQVFQVVAGHKFTAYSGMDDQFLLNLSHQGGGVIGALSNVVPELWSDLVRSANSGNFDRTMALAALIERLALLYEMDSNCSLMMKKLMVHRGVKISDRAVFPFNQMDEAVYQKAVALLDSVLEKYQALQ